GVEGVLGSRERVDAEAVGGDDELAKLVEHHLVALGVASDGAQAAALLVRGRDGGHREEVELQGRSPRGGPAGAPKVERVLQPEPGVSKPRRGRGGRAQIPSGLTAQLPGPSPNAHAGLVASGQRGSKCPRFICSTGTSRLSPTLRETSCSARVTRVTACMPS